MSANKQYYYNEQIEVKNKIESLKSLHSKISVFRLFVAIMIAVFFTMIFDNNTILFTVLTVSSLLFFIYLTNVHTVIEGNQKYYLAKQKVVENYILKINNDWINKIDIDLNRISNDNYLEQDLDIYKKGSLFQLISLTKTKEAKKRLLNVLNNIDTDGNVIKERQEAVQELVGLSDIHLKLSTLISMQNDFKTKSVNIDFSKKEIIFFTILPLIATIVSLFIIVLSMIGYLDILTSLFIIGITNAIILRYKNTKQKNILLEIEEYSKNINDIYQIIPYFEKKDFTSKKLNEMKMTLINEAQINASQNIKKLERLGELAIARKTSVVVYMLVSLLTLFPFFTIALFSRWYHKNKESLTNYFDTVYELEVLLSLGVIEQIAEVSVYPNFNTKGELNFKQIYHPFLNNKNCIKNDYTINNGITIVTGSNMSGKTTFIRAIGINLLLAYAGSAVCATEFNTDVFKLITSIRVEDNPNEGISTFYAEISRIKAMIDYSKTNKPMLCLVDEIFKGTNSDDRIYGASKAVEALNKPFIKALITTHDAQLTQLSFVNNIHFAEYYENNNLLFDYKLKQGPCQTRNAKHILKMAGIID